MLNVQGLGCKVSVYHMLAFMHKLLELEMLCER